MWNIETATRIANYNILPCHHYRYRIVVNSAPYSDQIRRHHLQKASDRGWYHSASCKEMWHAKPMSKYEWGELACTPRFLFLFTFPFLLLVQWSPWTLANSNSSAFHKMNNHLNRTNTCLASIPSNDCSGSPTIAFICGRRMLWHRKIEKHSTITLLWRSKMPRCFDLACMFCVIGLWAIHRQLRRSRLIWQSQNFTSSRNCTRGALFALT